MKDRSIGESQFKGGGAVALEVERQCLQPVPAVPQAARHQPTDAPKVRRGPRPSAGHESEPGKVAERHAQTAFARTADLRRGKAHVKLIARQPNRCDLGIRELEGGGQEGSPAGGNAAPRSPSSSRSTERWQRVSTSQ